MNTVKITSGKWRGQILATPGGATHPMGAREKLALFNIISEYLPGAKVLDAFAGSGALGIEALSRGAEKVVFIERNTAAVRVIRQNLAKVGAFGDVFAGKVRDFESADNFEVILADPPYDDFNVKEVAGLEKWLTNGGVLILSHPGAAPEIAGLKLEKTHQYAAAHLSVYSKH